jgi:hypothetical protein
MDLSGELPRINDNVPVVRFLHESNEFDQAKKLVDPKAFKPHKTDQVTSVFNLDPSDLNALWVHAATHGRQDKAAKAAAHLSVGAVIQSRLMVCAATPPPCHAEIRGWPFSGAADDLLRAQRMSMQQRLSSFSILLVK